MTAAPPPEADPPRKAGEAVAAAVAVADAAEATADTWAALRPLTPARIGLGRSGASLPTRALLAFGVDHARARDAVHAALEVGALAAQLAPLFGQPAQAVASAAGDRAAYLARPDWGRRLAPESAAALRGSAAADSRPDLLLVIADGLSAQAAQHHAVPLLQAALPRLAAAGLRIAAPVIATQARVALADEVAAILGARLVVSLIGERPGLSAPDSLGAYLTWAPQPSRTTDAERDCLSNIRPGGLDPVEAGERLAARILDVLARGRSGVTGPSPGAGADGAAAESVAVKEIGSLPAETPSV